MGFFHIHLPPTEIPSRAKTKAEAKRFGKKFLVGTVGTLAHHSDADCELQPSEASAKTDSDIQPANSEFIGSVSPQLVIFHRGESWIEREKRQRRRRSLMEKFEIGKWHAARYPRQLIRDY